MAKDSLKSKLMRVDIELEKAIRKHAKNNNLTLREASRQMAKMAEEKLSQKKLKGDFKI